MLMLPTSSRALRLAAGALTLAVALAACSSTGTASPSSAASTEPSAAASQPVAGGSAVTIKGFAFGPQSLTVAPGTTVTWTNQDSAGHTVTADDASFDSGTLSNGSNFSHTFSAAGTFAYHCSIHKSMTGTIVVQ